MISGYLNAMKYWETSGKGDDAYRATRPFITISRQCGAGGHLLAETIMDEIGKHKTDPLFQDWHIFDKELAEMIAGDKDLNVSLEELVDEDFHSEIEDIVRELLGYSPQFIVLKRIFAAIRRLAKVGHVILIGRGGSCVTRDLSGGIHIRVVAPEQERIGRMRSKLLVPAEEARKIIQKQDLSRARLIKTYFNRNIDDPVLYDIVANTGRTPFAVLARMVVNMVREKDRMQPVLTGAGGETRSE